MLRQSQTKDTALAATVPRYIHLVPIPVLQPNKQPIPGHEIVRMLELAVETRCFLVPVLFYEF